MEPVDLALVIVLDCSASVTFDEFNLMANGSGAALRDPAVVEGMLGGPHGAALGALLLFSDPGDEVVSVPWTRIASPQDLEQFASDVENTSRLVRAGSTGLGAALLACTRLLADMPAQAERRVLDVVGDGRANDGPAPAPIRDRLVDDGVTINGLCVLHEEPDLVESYTREVIGGPGAFAVSCQDYDGFAEAMRRKLRQEVA
jgi:Ca-activated chloride channel homolog